MVTADRPALCQRAIWCYLQQTYTNKELVVLDNGSQSMEPYLGAVSSEELRYKKIERTPDLTLGDLTKSRAGDGNWRVPDSAMGR